MLKIFYEKFWYPFFGSLLSKFVFLIEGNNKKKSLDKRNNIDKKIKL